jgi:hypothetical protein
MVVKMGTLRVAVHSNVIPYVWEGLINHKIEELCLSGTRESESTVRSVLHAGHM